MAQSPHIGTPHHTLLQSRGLTSDQASNAMSLGVNPDKVIQFIEKAGPVALRMLKILLPTLINDPDMVAMLTKIIDGALAGTLQL